ncbi:Zinc finger RING-type [Penicillium sp. DV-2018c]|nr:Zinc finger RING-type [Penicillium sp. DV-2018c]
MASRDGADIMESIQLHRRVPGEATREELLHIQCKARHPIQVPTLAASNIDPQSDLSSICTGSANLFVGTTDGFVHIVSSAFRVVRSFKAHDTGSITHMRQINDTALLVTVSEDLSNEPILKVWALDTERKDGGPKCLSTVSVQNARRQFPISAFTAVDDLSQVAVGFANGSVTIIRGDLIHDRGARQRIVFESEEPITGLETQTGAITTLYIATTSRILTLVIAGRGQGQPARVLEHTGCSLGCMTLDRESGDVLIAREEAVFTYGPRGRGASYAFEGPKTSIDAFRDYVALVCPPKAGTKSDPLRKYTASPAEEIFGTTTFTLLDTDLKFIAHSETLVSPMKRIFMEWGDLFLLTTEGKIFRYREKSLQQKLEILYERNLYILAINLAQKIGIDPLQQNAIYRKYGDFLYQRGDYDTAMQQYLRAIDNTEPSQVIRKYLDTQRIHNLIEYLEELHDHGRATVDHTTLLLNCYAKLKDTSKLDSFIKAPGELKFDLETAIAMCRQGGYYEQAAYLATKHGENDMVVDILIEDSKKYAEAVEYIWRLEPEARTSELFKVYYSGQYRPRTEVEQPAEPSTQTSSTVQSLAALLPLRYMNVGTSTQPQVQPAEPDTNEDDDKDSPPQYNIPKPRTAFSAFVDHPKEFIDFLETLAQQPDLKKDAKIDLFTTLFEMYLDTAKGTKDASERQEWETKAKKLIEGKDIPISTSNVLLLSDLSNFREGSTLVREQEGLRLDIFRSFTSARDTQGAIKALRRYGPDEPQLYIDALTYFASSPQILDEAGDELDAVLQRINQDGLLSPLQVIQALSNNAVVTMGRVKKYLSDNIDRERKDITTNRRLISSYKSETETKQQELNNLSTQPVVFQSRRCQSCGGTLDLPTVHFLCKHSFHERCLNNLDEDAQCPVCAPTNATLRAIRQRQVESADQHDLFKGELARSRDRFGVVSEFFGRGVMRSQSTME